MLPLGGVIADRVGRAAGHRDHRRHPERLRGHRRPRCSSRHATIPLLVGLSLHHGHPQRPVVAGLQRPRARRRRGGAPAAGQRLHQRRRPTRGLIVGQRGRRRCSSPRSAQGSPSPSTRRPSWSPGLLVFTFRHVSQPHDLGRVDARATSPTAGGCSSPSGGSWVDHAVASASSSWCFAAPRRSWARCSRWRSTAARRAGRSCWRFMSVGLLVGRRHRLAHPGAPPDAVRDADHASRCRCGS